MIVRLLLVLTLFQSTAVSQDALNSDSKESREVHGFQTLRVNQSTEGLDGPFWDKVAELLKVGPVEVVFGVGAYHLKAPMSLTEIGSDDHPLHIRCNSDLGATMTSESIGAFKLDRCRNVRISGFVFSGNFKGNVIKLDRCVRAEVSNCLFRDLPELGYAGVSVTHSGTDQITVCDSEFIRVGKDSHAHMIYAAYGVKRLRVICNRFEDCSGAYVRFRGDLSDKGVVYGNTFSSTGTYNHDNRVFIEVPVINDVEPGDERFGTEFMITKNVFSYSEKGKQGTRFALSFHHSGFSPKDRSHLLTPAEAKLLGQGSKEERRKVMTKNLGLDGSAIRFGGNTNVNVAKNVVYVVKKRKEQNSVPWEGFVSIGIAVTADGLVKNRAEAMRYFD